MSDQTEHFNRLFRGIALRRKAFIKKPNTNELIYPPRGQIWEPSKHEEAMCDAFILFFVAELEEYFEGIVGDGIYVFREIFLAHALRHCLASKDFITKIDEKKASLSKNNNANWSRISHFFDFLGMKKEIHFPVDFWDDIESIVKHRGDLVHNGTSLAIVEDRRNVIAKIETSITRAKAFDTQYKTWMDRMNSELTRTRSISLDFTPTYLPA